MKRKKFKRQDYFRYKKIKSKWRKPRGRQSKQRKQRKTKLGMPNIGYGKKEKKHTIIITNLNDIEKIDNEKVLISSRIGLKKARQIIEKVIRKKINVSNAKRIMKNIEKREKEIKKRKEGRAKKGKTDELGRKESEK